VYSYTATGSIWYRHFLRFVGVNPDAIQWWIGDIDTPGLRRDQPQLHGVDVRRKKRVAFSHMSFCVAGSPSVSRHAMTASA
jgi:hypothetical protein